ncbi:hypothetical protein PsorP6_016159 [Peronosclerospora sorghi]|uniref:Uncharacterized protein n=1 Tax=Peronosclerospora sorghi TaxID=230839 RepID=A0ACC0VQN2_9STRA|nr:hypothetical protein PsorP6_016159 [Peronosclerospora sorghi]
MKIGLVALAACAGATHADVPVVPTARMAQFLQEKSNLELELKTWKQSAAGQFAKEQGFVPAPTLREAEGADDEELRRFFLSKVLIEEAQAMNPEALFSVETPFTLMTKEEFTKFVGKSNQRGAPVFPAVPRVAQEALNSTLSASSEKDWTTSGCVVNVKNQGQCGSCWAFAAVAALESAICIAGQPLTSLSEQQVVDCDTSSYACEGGFPGNALSFIQRAGAICTADSYAYVSGSTGDRETCETSCTSKPVTIRDVVTVPESDLGLLEAISDRPVAVGVAAGNPTWKQYKSGIVSSCSSTELDHAVLAVGYGDCGSSSYYKIKNSWGTQWGEAGYMRLKRGADTGKSGTCGIIGSHSVYPQL